MAGRGANFQHLPRAGHFLTSCQATRASIDSLGSEVTAIVYAGIKLAKSVFALRGTDEHGRRCNAAECVSRQAARPECIAGGMSDRAACSGVAGPSRLMDPRVGEIFRYQVHEQSG
jgi:hypothetical protein